jgi:hypothetical protein
VGNFNKFVVYFAGFSLMNWFTTTGYSDSSPLTGDALDDLEEILGKYTTNILKIPTQR